jgi:hypothetical protein
VSHLLQRKENNCLNCGSTVLGRYCHICGQENIEPKESFWQLVLHFFGDITHFDGKFFSTLKDLMVKPGFLSKEYMQGRRVKYLNPIRMYMFTSFIFFLIFFSLYHIDENQINNKIEFNGKTSAQIEQMSPKDFVDFTRVINNGAPLSRQGYVQFRDSIKQTGGIHFTSHRYKNKAEYDSLLKTGVKKHNWLQRKLVYKEIEMNDKYVHDQAKLLKAVVTAFMHNFPQILFISLPFIALFLKLLYIRHKQFYYVSHAIFSIHYFIFVFIMMLVTIGISKLETLLQWKWIGYLNVLVTLIIFFYLYKAMRKFYEQRRAKTFLKYFLFLFSFLILNTFLLIVFFFISVFQV